MRELKEYHEDDSVLKEFLEMAEIGNLQQEELDMYKASQKAEWDEHARITTATEIGEEAGLQKGLKKGEAIGLQKGETIGLKKGREEVAKTMLTEGLDIQLISKVTGLTEKEIKSL